MIDTQRRILAGIDRDAWRPVLPLLALQFLSGIWYMPQLFFFPIYLEEKLGLLPVVIAMFVAAGQLAGLFAGLAGGALSDSRGSKWVLVLGLVFAVIATFTFRASQPWLIALLWVMGGLAIGFHTTGGQSYVTRVADPRSLGLAAALYALCLTLGGAAGNPLAGRVLDTRGFAAFGIMLLVLAVATLIGAIVLLPPVGADRFGAPRAPGGGRGGSLALARRTTVQILVALRFLPTVYYAMLGVLIPLLINRLAGNKSTVAMYASLSLIVASTAQLAAGRAADRFGRRVPLAVGFGTLVLSAFGLAAFNDELWGLFVFGVMGNAAAWALAALMFVLVSDGVARAEHGRVFGLLHASWSLAMIVGALIGGRLVQVGPGLPFLVGGLLNILSIFLAFAFLARVQRGDALRDAPLASP
jgi:MFS family permease